MEQQSNEERFAGSGIKNTRQRNAVFNVLKSQGGALTAEELYIKLVEQETPISLSTIYRILNLFVSKGLAIKSVISNDKKAVYESSRIPYRHYLICTNCHQNIEIEDCPLPGLEKSLAEETEYVIYGHKLDVYGCCPRCQQKEKRDQNRKKHHAQQ